MLFLGRFSGLTNQGGIIGVDQNLIIFSIVYLPRIVEHFRQRNGGAANGKRV